MKDNVQWAWEDLLWTSSGAKLKAASHPQKMEASYYDSIMEQQRLEPEFFRVGFYGRKFPFFLRVSPFRRHSEIPLHRLPVCFSPVP